MKSEQAGTPDSKMTKIHPRGVSSDICQKSLDLLEQAINQWFAARGVSSEKIWYADQESHAMTTGFPKSKSDIEVVLTGNFLYRLFESPLWPFENFRIWVLSSRVRNILIEVLGFNESQIGLIPAKELHAPSNNSTKPENQTLLQLPLKWIFAGRISAGKNVLGLLETVYFLQTEQGLPVQLEFFGKFDESKDGSFGRYQDFSHEKIVRQLVQDLPWTVAPVFRGEVDQFTWLKSCGKGSALVSFSTHMCEDFGTSPWLAYQSGTPCLLSDWGGFADQDSELVRLIPNSLTPQTYLPATLRTAKAKTLARLLATQFLSFQYPGNCDSLETSPTGITRNEFSMQLQSFLSTQLPEVLMLARNYPDRFADTAKGKSFFLHYRFLMAGGVFPETLYAVNDLNPENAKNISLEQACLKILEQAKLPMTFDFIQSNDLLAAFYLRNSAQIKKIEFLNSSPASEKLRQLYQELL